jgi:cytochrome b561
MAIRRDPFELANPSAPSSGAVPTSARFNSPAIALHWLTALGLLAVFPLGVYMVDLPLSPSRIKLYAYHKWLGVTLFGLVALRLLWRLVHRPPAWPLGLAEWQRKAAAVVHAAMYAAMFALPLSGWLYSSAAGVPTVYLGWWQLPDLVDRDRALAETLKGVHLWTGYSLIGLFALHVAGALKHQFVDRDGLMHRMLPAGRRPRSSS